MSEVKEYYEKLKIKVESKTKEYFKIIDFDQNGTVSLDEWLSCQKIFSAAIGEEFDEKQNIQDFKDLDINKDDKLEEEEFLKGSLSHIESIEEDLEKMSLDDIKNIEKQVLEQMDEYIKALNNKKN
jgi:hypothetical protein